MGGLFSLVTNVARRQVEETVARAVRSVVLTLLAAVLLGIGLVFGAIAAHRWLEGLYGPIVAPLIVAGPSSSSRPSSFWRPVPSARPGASSAHRARALRPRAHHPRRHPRRTSRQRWKPRRSPPGASLRSRSTASSLRSWR